MSKKVNRTLYIDESPRVESEVQLIERHFNSKLIGVSEIMEAIRRISLIIPYQRDCKILNQPLIFSMHNPG